MGYVFAMTCWMACLNRGPLVVVIGHGGCYRPILRVGRTVSDRVAQMDMGWSGPDRWVTGRRTVSA